MGASQPIIPKYYVKAHFDIEGVVEKSDIIGALFGQTEGLFGSELDLRELQKSGRIGRIEVDVESKEGKTRGTIAVPSSLDKATTALIAAVIESVDRVGPCIAKVNLSKIEDIRESRRLEIISRAKAILKQWNIDFIPKVEEAIKEISEVSKPVEIVSYGPEGLSAGPEMERSDSIILVEGRADVQNLAKSGILNSVACEGVKIPETIIRLIKEKEVTAFLDGDRGGDLILKELQQLAEIDYIARAPRGKEVEDLSTEEILTALKNRIPVESLKRPQRRLRRREEIKAPIQPPRDTSKESAREVPKGIAELLPSLRGTLEAVLFDGKMNQMNRMPVSELYEALQKAEDVDTVVFDGVITQRLVDVASEKKIKQIVGDRLSEIAKRPVDIRLFTFSDLESGERRAA